MVTEVIVERSPEEFNHLTPVKEDPVAMVTEVAVEQPPPLQEDLSPEKGESVAMVTEVIVESSHTFTRKTTLETKSTPVSPQPTYNLLSPTPYVCFLLMMYLVEIAELIHFQVGRSSHLKCYLYYRHPD